MDDAPDEKWMNIDLCLARGFRGLPGGWSLAQLLDEFRGKRNWPGSSIGAAEITAMWLARHCKANLLSPRLEHHFTGPLRTA